MERQAQHYKRAVGGGTSRQAWLRVSATLVLALLIVVSYLLGDLPAATYLRIITDTSHPLSSEFGYLNSTSFAEGGIPDGYLVWSSGCRIPDLAVMHDSIAKLIKRAVKPKCGPVLSVITKEYLNESTSNVTLHLSDSLSSATCCLSTVKRKPANSTKGDHLDDQYLLSKCSRIMGRSIALAEESEFIKVKCTKNKKKEFYSGMHAFVTKTKQIKEKLKRQTKDGTSVILVGIDSISRLNLFRTMPKTVKHLEQTGWINLKGYNKMGDNTFPNLIAILTGMTDDQLKETCWPNRKVYLDECPFIWKNFSSRDYITAYFEDEASIGTFNYYKLGFKQSPTDYYSRPFFVAAEKYLKLNIMNYMKICLGPHYAIDHVLNYTLDFIKEFHNHLYFGLFWINSISHQDLNLPSAFDNNLLTFFRHLENTGTLNTTIVIFLSDHGVRFGKIRETYVGYIEERLPFIYFWYPENLRKKNPERYKNLLANRNRLTSPFDLHATLQDILGNQSERPPSCPTCHSLFHQVSWNRSCSDAGITPHWCTCSEYKVIDLQSAWAYPVESLVRFVTDELNKIISDGYESFANGTECAHLAATKLHSIRTKVFSKKVNFEEYVLLLETSPGSALFEATVKHQYQFHLVDTISRVNQYGNQAWCVSDYYLKKYCFCHKL